MNIFDHSLAQIPGMKHSFGTQISKKNWQDIRWMCQIKNNAYLIARIIILIVRLRIGSSIDWSGIQCALMALIVVGMLFAKTEISIQEI